MKRNGIRNVIILAIIVAVCAIITIGIVNSGREDLSENSQDKVTTEKELSVWLTEWNWQEGMADLEKLTSAPESIQAFGAYFDENDDLLFVDGFEEKSSELLQTKQDSSKTQIYLTIVNDIIGQDGASVQKDSDLISRLMRSSESRSAHIESIIAAVQERSYDGVEIDYENIAEKDWDTVTTFYSELYDRVLDEGLALRIILEPRAPLDKLSLPNGPDYVLMAYNLYGTHSGPGPKTDIAFIGKLAARLDHVPGDAVLAFSTGGFDWSKDGGISALTERDAVELARRSEEQPKRDEASGALHMDYVDEKGIKHSIWYADSTTLSMWIDAAEQRGIHRFAIWKLGDLSDPSLDYLSYM